MHLRRTSLRVVRDGCGEAEADRTEPVPPGLLEIPYFFPVAKDGAIKVLKGSVVKASRGKSNPKLVDETLRRLLAE